MRVKLLESGNVVEFEDVYALRLIEQGTAILVSGDTPVTPEPTPYDPSEYNALFVELQSRTASLQEQVNALAANARDDATFAGMYQSIAQAQQRKLEDDAALMQAEIDAMSGEE